MKKNIIKNCSFLASSLLLGTGISASAAVVVGVDFSDSAAFNTAGGAFDITPDDLDAGDDITVSAWTAESIGPDGNANGGAVDGRAARFQNNNTFSVTIGAAGSFSFSDLDFLARAATTGGDTRTVRVSYFVGAPASAVTGAGDNFTEILRSGALPNRTGSPTFEVFNLDLTSEAALQNLTGTSVTFNFQGVENGVDIDTIEISADPIPEPSTALLGVLGALALVRRRR